MIRVGIYGVTGYAGYELLRWLQRHGEAEVVFTVSESQAGKMLSEVYPGPLEATLIAPGDAPLGDVDVVFLGLPHGVAGTTALRALDAGARVVDLSADFRLTTAAAYKQWYKHDHPVPNLLPVPYGIPELYRETLCDAKLIANPGCYPTSVLLGLAPLLKAALITDDTVIVDSKSGVSGAGRPPKQHTSFVEASENLTPYGIGHSHRHVSEIEQEMARLWGAEALPADEHAAAPTVLFSPHLLPISRGILSTMYVRVPTTLQEGDLRSLYQEEYAGEPFVRVLPAGQLAAIGHSTNTNMCVLSLTLARPGHLIVVSSLDNLVKGAAGQAIQNMNAMFGLNEATGLR